MRIVQSFLRIISIFVIPFGCSFDPVFANKNKELWLDEVKSVVVKYKENKGIVMNLRKKVRLELLDEEKTSQGKLWFSRGQLKVKISSPEKSLIVMNNKKVWTVQFLPKELGGKTQVGVMVSPKYTKITKVPLVFLLSVPEAWEEFKLLKKSKQNGYAQFELAAKSESRMPSITKIILEMDTSKKLIKKIGYVDELDNLTTYEFSKVKFGVSLSASKFRYKPPANAEITYY